MRTARFRLTTALALTLTLACLAGWAQAPTLSLQPPVIEMGPTYGGARLLIQGTVSPGSQVVVAVRGPGVEEVFNKMGRMGPVWVNDGKVRVSGVPSLFLCFSSGPLDGMLDREALDRDQLDERAILAQMVIRPEAADRETIRSNYLGLKTQQGTFRVSEGAVRIEAAGASAGSRFSLDLAWPKRAPPSTYEVAAYECRGREVVGRASAPLEVREVGFPLTLARLANDRAVLYGALCVLLAMMAGFGIDFLVTRLGKRSLAGH